MSLYFNDFCCFSTIRTSTSLSSSTEEIVNKANLLITHSFAMMMMLCTFVFLLHSCLFGYLIYFFILLLILYNRLTITITPLISFFNNLYFLQKKEFAITDDLECSHYFSCKHYRAWKSYCCYWHFSLRNCILKRKEQKAEEYFTATDSCKKP